MLLTLQHIVIWCRRPDATCQFHVIRVFIWMPFNMDAMADYINVDYNIHQVPSSHMRHRSKYFDKGHMLAVTLSQHVSAEDLWHLSLKRLKRISWTSTEFGVWTTDYPNITIWDVNIHSKSNLNGGLAKVPSTLGIHLTHFHQGYFADKCNHTFDPLNVELSWKMLEKTSWECTKSCHHITNETQHNKSVYMIHVAVYIS